MHNTARGMYSGTSLCLTLRAPAAVVNVPDIRSNRGGSHPRYRHDENKKAPTKNVEAFLFLWRIARDSNPR